MNTFSPLEQIVATVFGILAILFGILSLLSIKRDPRYPPMEARIRSLRKNVRYLFLCSVFLLLCALVVKPDIKHSVIPCLIGNAVVLTIYYGITILIYKFLHQLNLDKKFEQREKSDASKEDEHNI